MNGGFALKLASTPDAVVAALRVVAAAEQIELREPPAESGDAIGIGVRDGTTLIVPRDVGDVELLRGLGQALAAQLGCPTCVVVDSDEGCECLDGWNGGDSLAPETGWLAWDFFSTLDPARAACRAVRSRCRRGA